MKYNRLLLLINNGRIISSNSVKIIVIISPISDIYGISERFARTVLLTSIIVNQVLAQNQDTRVFPWVYPKSWIYPKPSAIVCLVILYLNLTKKFSF